MSHAPDSAGEEQLIYVTSDVGTLRNALGSHDRVAHYVEVERILASGSGAAAAVNERCAAFTQPDNGHHSFMIGCSDLPS